MDCKTQFEITFILKLIYNFKAISIKFPIGFLGEQIEKLLLNMYGNTRDLGQPKRFWKEKKGPIPGGFKISDFKIYYKIK